MRCGHGREFKSGPAKPVAMVDSRAGLAGTGANPRVLKARGRRFKVQRLGERGAKEWKDSVRDLVSNTAQG